MREIRQGSGVNVGAPRAIAAVDVLEFWAPVEIDLVIIDKGRRLVAVGARNPTLGAGNATRHRG